MVNVHSDRWHRGVGRSERACHAVVVETRTFPVVGMTCDHCVSAVTSEVSAVPGISAVAVDLHGATLTVTAERIDADAIAVAVDEAGYALG
jgi:copper chaperone